MTPLPQATIDRSSPVPFYFQLAEMLEQEIVSGRWGAGTRLPSEPDLCEHFGLSRTTVRQALARLEQRGLIDRLKGQGTFVARNESGMWLLQSSGGFFQEEVDRFGRTVTSRVLRRDHGRLPAWACDALDLSPEADGATLERLRFVDGEVAMYVINHLPDRLSEVALDVGNPNESLYRRLRDRGGVEPHGGRRTLEAVAAEERLAEMLELDPGAPVALIQSATWDATMRPFDCYRAWLRTDRTRIDIEVMGASPQTHPLSADARSSANAR